MYSKRLVPDYISEKKMKNIKLTVMVMDDVSHAWDQIILNTYVDPKTKKPNIMEDSIRCCNN